MDSYPPPYKRSSTINPTRIKPRSMQDGCEETTRHPYRACEMLKGITSPDQLPQSATERKPPGSIRAVFLLYHKPQPLSIHQTPPMPQEARTARLSPPGILSGSTIPGTLQRPQRRSCEPMSAELVPVQCRPDWSRRPAYMKRLCQSTPSAAARSDDILQGQPANKIGILTLYFQMT